jgi:hypothetical protein
LGEIATKSCKKKWRKNFSHLNWAENEKIGKFSASDSMSGRGGNKIWVGEIKLALKQFKRKVNLLLICVEIVGHFSRIAEHCKTSTKKIELGDEARWTLWGLKKSWFNILWENYPLHNISKKSNKREKNTIERQTFN